MINDIINAEKYQNSVSEFLFSIRQGIPSAVFGVTEAFSNYFVSLIPNKTLVVVKDRLVGFNACKQIAEFSNLVTEAWEAGDKVAEEIIEMNCRRLADLVKYISGQTPKAKQILLSGSILINCRQFRELLIQMLPKQLKAGCIPCPPVFGACLECAKLCRLPAPDMDTFVRQYEIEVQR